MKNKEIKSNENKHKVLRYKKKAKGVIYNKVFGWFLKLKDVFSHHLINLLIDIEA